MNAEPLLFLTGHISTIFTPVRTTKKIWPQKLLLSIVAHNQLAAELVKILFAKLERA